MASSEPPPDHEPAEAARPEIDKSDCPGSLTPEALEPEDDDRRSAGQRPPAEPADPE
jgi:hypothetical protein